MGYNLASSTHSISVCNALRAGSLACGYAWQNGWNRSCNSILETDRSFASANNTIMTSLKTGKNDVTCNVVNCSETSGYCSYNKPAQNLKYCKGDTCGSVCDDDNDCKAYNTNSYCSSGVCRT